MVEHKPALNLLIAPISSRLPAMDRKPETAPQKRVAFQFSGALPRVQMQYITHTTPTTEQKMPRERAFPEKSLKC